MTRPTTPRRVIAAAGSLALVCVLVPQLAAPASAGTGPAAPTGIHLTRAADNPADFVVSWKPVAGVDHYNVSVFDGALDAVTAIPATTTSLRVKGTSACSQYRVTVGSRDTAGAGSTTGYTWLKSLAPGAVTALTATRSADHTTATATWALPASTGYGSFTGYSVQVVRLADGVVVQKRTSPDAVETLKGLDPKKSYVAKVWAANAYGQCGVARAMLGNQLPGGPRALAAVRDAGVPALVNLSWKAPAWPGYTPVTSYLLGYGDLRITTWVKVSGTTAQLKLDPALSHVFQVRAVNTAGNGSLTSTVTLGRSGAPGSAAVPPSVSLDELNGVVTITTKGPIGSSTTYPNLVMSVRPSVGTVGYTDSQSGQNGAQTVTFQPIPCGAYTITVNGSGPTGQVEFARKVINRCDTGILNANEWKVVRGSAKLADGGVVDMPNGAETRVVSTRARTSQDMVFTTTANLRSGQGYGIWTRAALETDNTVSGYSFQFDPGYKTVDAGFGPAFVLRHWYKGAECGTVLARTKIPASIAVYGTHKVVVVAKGDGLYATIDNVVVFDVPSLSKAIAASPCHFPAPAGTEVGFRTWGSGTSAVFSTTTLG
jgi:hypothetical protein